MRDLDPLGHTTSYTYNAAIGRMATITDPLGHVTTINSYDPLGRPAVITDPNGLITGLGYNFRGDVTSSTVGSELTTYSYDLAGQLMKLPCRTRHSTPLPMTPPTG
jgi:YD repeat-containing protein